MRCKLLRSTLLGLVIGVVAVPIARADDTRPEAGATAQRGGSGPERMGGQPMMGPPHAPSVVGQSPLPLQAGDPRDVEQRAQPAPPPRVYWVVPGPPAQNGSGLNDQSPTGK